MLVRRFALAVAIASSSSCASTPEAPSAQSGAEDTAEDQNELDAEEIDDVVDVSQGRGEGSSSVTYARTAKENWRRGEEEFADESYVAAQKYYTFIRSKFPYSSFAIRSELRIADCLFERERHLEAIDAYSNFQRLHPTHEKVGYAAYRIGVSYYRQIPGDWFMLPPSWEKDQAAIRDAARSLTAYVERFPNDPSYEEGNKLLQEVRERLVRHERAVADFYRGADKPKAYVGRLEVIREKYADVALTDELLVEIAEAYVELADVDAARAAVAQLETKFPSSPRLGRARALVGGATHRAPGTTQTSSSAALPPTAE